MSRKKGKKKSDKAVSGKEKAPPLKKGEEQPASPSKDSDEEEDLSALKKKAQERDEFRERVQRITADFSNYQKRMQRETEETRKYAASSIALDLLSALDNFQRAIEAAEGKLDNDFLKGFKMIEAQLHSTLKKHGVTPIEALNMPFDPNIHDALMEVEEAAFPDKTVLEEFEKGYLIHDRLLRPARVKVSRIPQEPAATEEEDDSEKESQETKADESEMDEIESEDK